MREAPVITFPDIFIRQCMQEADRHYPCETGGVLMGYSLDHAVTHVTNIIEAGPNASHRRHSFEFDHERQSEKIAEIYSNSGRRVTYIGDWHSHPDDERGTLSPMDKRTMRKIIDTPAARAPNPYSIILFGKPNEWHISAYCALLQNRWRFFKKLIVTEAEISTY